MPYLYIFYWKSQFCSYFCTKYDKNPPISKFTIYLSPPKNFNQFNQLLYMSSDNNSLENFSENHAKIVAKASRKRTILLVLFVSLAILISSFSFYAYQVANSPNFCFGKKPVYLYLPQGATFQTVLDSLKKNDIIYNVTSFAFMSKILKYQENVKPGRYLIETNMNNIKLVRNLRAGAQAPQKVIFNNIRLKEDLADRLCPQVTIKREDLLKALNDDKYTQKYGFTSANIMAMFLPNTYEVYWNVSLDGFFEKMHKEYQKFWTPERLAKAKAINLTPIEVAVLAAIVDAETVKTDEKPRVASVYMNRLAKKDLLQADPTVIFATGDFTIKRVLNVHLATDSPYNTYKYKGLPPGVIRLPTISGLDAVLNHEKTDFYFFCAKEDFSGYHNFAIKLSEHNQNAKRYQAALNVLLAKKKAEGKL